MVQVGPSFYVAELYATDEQQRLLMTDITTFLADDLTDAKVRCEAWASCYEHPSRPKHVTLRRNKSVVYLRALAARAIRVPPATQFQPSHVKHRPSAWPEPAREAAALRPVPR